MPYTFQVNMDFSVAGNIIEFLSRRKMIKKHHQGKHNNVEPALVDKIDAGRLMCVTTNNYRWKKTKIHIRDGIAADN
jgi:hypothetical protein